MKTKMRLRLVPVLLLAAVIALMLPQKASALGTASNVTIANKATIGYQVNLIPQTAIESAPGAGNSTPGVGLGTNTTFLVDDKVNVTIAANDVAMVTTYPGSSAQALKFTVENTGNTVHDFALTALLDPANTFVATSVTIYRDGGDGVYDGVDDVAVTFLDEMAVDTPQVVWVVAAVPIGATNGQAANYALKAEAHAAGGAGLGALSAQTNVGAPDNAAAVDVVFADGDGDAGQANDANYDGAFVAWGGNELPDGTVGPTGGFLVSGALLTVTKTSAVIADPILGVSANAKAIPLATVEYTITIANGAGAATATSVAITDTIDANTTGVYNAYGAGPDGVTVNFNGGGALAGTSAADGVDASGYNSSFVAGSISVSGVTLAAGQNAVIKYQVTIN